MKNVDLVYFGYEWDDDSRLLVRELDDFVIPAEVVNDNNE